MLLKLVSGDYLVVEGTSHILLLVSYGSPPVFHQVRKILQDDDKPVPVIVSDLNL